MDAKRGVVVNALILFPLVLNIKMPQTSVSVPNAFGGIASRNSNCTGNKSIAFDWVPPDVSEDVVSCSHFKRCKNNFFLHGACMVRFLLLLSD
jgi:hypothetical protein